MVALFFRYSLGSFDGDEYEERAALREGALGERPWVRGA